MSETTTLELMLKCHEYFKMAYCKGLVGMSDGYIQVTPYFIKTLTGATLSVCWAGANVEVTAMLDGKRFIALL